MVKNACYCMQVASCVVRSRFSCTPIRRRTEIEDRRFEILDRRTAILHKSIILNARTHHQPAAYHTIPAAARRHRPLDGTTSYLISNKLCVEELANGHNIILLGGSISLFPSAPSIGLPFRCKFSALFCCM